MANMEKTSGSKGGDLKVGDIIEYDVATQHTEGEIVAIITKEEVDKTTGQTHHASEEKPMAKVKNSSTHHVSYHYLDKINAKSSSSSSDKKDSSEKSDRSSTSSEKSEKGDKSRDEDLRSGDFVEYHQGANATSGEIVEIITEDEIDESTAQTRHASKEKPLAKVKNSSTHHISYHHLDQLKRGKREESSKSDSNKDTDYDFKAGDKVNYYQGANETQGEIIDIITEEEIDPSTSQIRHASKETPLAKVKNSNTHHMSYHHLDKLNKSDETSEKSSKSDRSEKSSKSDRSEKSERSEKDSHSTSDLKKGAHVEYLQGQNMTTGEILEIITEEETDPSTGQIRHASEEKPMARVKNSHTHHISYHNLDKLSVSHKRDRESDKDSHTDKKTKTEDDAKSAVTATQ